MAEAVLQGWGHTKAGFWGLGWVLWDGARVRKSVGSRDCMIYAIVIATAVESFPEVFRDLRSRF